LKINLITPPDILHNDSYQLLVLYPGKELQKQLQYDFLGKIEHSVNLYYYDKPEYNKDDIDWVLNAFNIADLVLIDVDNCEPHAKDLLSYLIAKPKTFWLTNSQQSVYNHISKNKVYNLDFLQNLGGNLEKK
jgi:hypothetical protein